MVTLTWLRRCAVTVVAVAAILVPVTPSYASPSCWLEYHLISFWPAGSMGPAGFHGEFTIHNGGTTASTAWSLSATWIAGTVVTEVYNALPTGTGPSYTFRNMSLNGSVAADAVTTFGVIGQRPGNYSSGNPYQRNCAMT